MQREMQIDLAHMIEYYVAREIDAIPMGTEYDWGVRPPSTIGGFDQILGQPAVTVWWDDGVVDMPV
jgi:hypothetical protein